MLSASPLITAVELGPATGRYISLDDFYIRDHFAVPPADTLGLRIEGEVERPQTLSSDRLSSFPKIEQSAVLECAGSLVATLCQACNGLWQGWHMGDILAVAKPTSSAKFVHLYGRDGYRRTIPFERAHEDGLLVSHLNRLPLRPNHGAALRAFFPGWYGMDSVKWLDRMVVSSSPLTSDTPYLYMQAHRQNGNDLDLQPLPRMQVKSIIVSPSERAVLQAGPLELKGLAWSGTGSISEVEVSADGGRSWKEAQFTPRSRFEWIAWYSHLNLSAGPVEFVCRTKDTSGAVQPSTRDESRADPYANNWYHRVNCVVV